MSRDEAVAPTANVSAAGGCDGPWRPKPLAITFNKSAVGKAPVDMDYRDRR